MGSLFRWGTERVGAGVMQACRCHAGVQVSLQVSVLDICSF